MSIERNIQTVKDFFAAIGRGDRDGFPTTDVAEQEAGFSDVPGAEMWPQDRT